MPSRFIRKISNWPVRALENAIRFLKEAGADGVKVEGAGATLSRVGYESLTRPKSYHLREVK